jgi:hypothetical protein
MNANEGFDSESRFQALFDQAPTSMQLLRADGTTIQVNRAWRLLWEMPDGSALSDYVLSGAYNVLTDPQLREKGVTPYLERAFAGESVKIPVAKYDPALLGKPGRIKGGEPADKNTEASIAIPFGVSTMIGRLACSKMPWRTLLSTPNVINTEATPLKKNAGTKSTFSDIGKLRARRNRPSTHSRSAITRMRATSFALTRPVVGSALAIASACLNTSNQSRKETTG